MINIYEIFTNKLVAQIERGIIEYKESSHSMIMIYKDGRIAGIFPAAHFYAINESVSKKIS